MANPPHTLPAPPHSPAETGVLLCSLGWPPTHSSFPTSGPQTLGLQNYTYNHICLSINVLKSLKKKKSKWKEFLVTVFPKCMSIRFEVHIQYFYLCVYLVALGFESSILYKLTIPSISDRSEYSEVYNVRFLYTIQGISRPSSFTT